MALYKVVWEIELDAETPLEAAQQAMDWLQDRDGTPQQFYVQEDGERELFSVDLSEPEDQQVYPVEEYVPLIRRPYDNIS